LAGLLCDRRLAGSHDDPETARYLAEASLATMRALGHRQGIGQCCYFLGRLARDLGDTEAARALWTECRAIEEEEGTRGGHVLPMLGELALESGDPAGADDGFPTYLLECRQTGNRWRMAWALRGMVAVARAEDEPQRAARLPSASLALHETLDGRRTRRTGAPCERSLGKRPWRRRGTPGGR
jgi:hypothetical protein